MTLHFKCTQCTKCCRDTNVPLTVSEAIGWLNRGHGVQVLCEASPWPEAMDADPSALHFKRRSFAAMSGSMPTRVVVMLVANVIGACPNLLADGRCGIYEDRPLVCRIYPAEINPMIALEPGNRACPPEAWAADLPVLQHEEGLMSESTRRDIASSRAADAHDAEVKSRLCLALKLNVAALVHEAILAYSPAADALLSGLILASANGCAPAGATSWNFVSDQPETRTALAGNGAAVLHPRDTASAAFRLFGLKRAALFGPDAHREPAPLAPS